MLVDHHLHLIEKNQLPLTAATLAPYFKTGRQQGVNIFAFLDHAYLFKEADSINFTNWQNHKQNFKLHQFVKPLKKIQAQQPSGNKQQILIGLEIDYQKENADKLAAFIEKYQQQYQFDFLMGSVHWVWDKHSEAHIGIDLTEHLDQLKKQPVNELYAQYFSIIKAAIQSQLFDIIGHLDLIKHFNFQTQNRSFISGLVALLKKYHQVIEVNTSGLIRPVQEIYPALDLLKSCYQSGIEITLSSDAHTHERVGADFNKALKIIKRIGYSSLVYFKNRQKHYLSI